MKAAVLAAGKGERLTSAGIETAKPLIAIGGQPLISRVIHAAARVGVSAAVSIVNEESPALSRYLSSSDWPLPLKVITKTTDNSLESFTALAPHLSDEPFLLFTADAVFRQSALERFLRGARSLGTGALAVTRYVDDEKPLYIGVGPDHRVSGVDQDALGSPYVTAGFYYFEPAVLDLLPEARAVGLNSLRKFFGFLHRKGYPLFAIRVSKTIDVDRPEDIEAAEDYVRRQGGMRQ